MPRRPPEGWAWSPKTAAELVRVTRPGGRVLATEFCWRTPPTEEARQVLGQVCPDMQFDTVQDWAGIYPTAGLSGLDTQTGPFEMMTARGFLAGAPAKLPDRRRCR